jgi:dTDP-4-dehydrorhamnose 3,5-epimerase
MCSRPGARIEPVNLTRLEGVSGTGGLPAAVLIEPRVFHDDRGSFWEFFEHRRYRAADLPERGLSFVQDNLSRSRRGVVRGLHYQLARPQAKLVTCLTGEILDVIVDLRRGSPDFGRARAVTLSDDNRRQLYVPIGFAHGFCAVSERADVLYKVTDFYDPPSERTLLWNDPALGIAWPFPAEEAIVSEKDRRGLPLARAEVFE